MKFTEEQLNSLSINVRAYYDYQNERLAMDGRLGQKKDGKLKKNIPVRDPALLIYLQYRRDQLTEVEKGMEKDIRQIVIKHPLWQVFLKNVKGCGPIMAGVIISQFDIHKAPTVSNLVSFAGLAPGKDRREKGKKCPYNQFLRAKLCGVLGGSFLKSKSVPYSRYYYDHKLRLENSYYKVEERLRNEDKKKKQYKGMKSRIVPWREAYPDHRHKAAIRKMIKEFLKDLYVAWREIEGLPIRKPYEEEYLDKVHHKAA